MARSLLKAKVLTAMMHFLLQAQKMMCLKEFIIIVGSSDLA
jgi:hypothetical protein